MAGALVGTCGGCGERLVAVQLRPRPSPSSQSFFTHVKNSCRLPLGLSVDNILFSKRNQEVRVAADYSDSKPESFKRQGKWGYHPLEDLSKGEKDEIEHSGAGKLTNAELARTISEVNWSAFIYSSIISDKDAVYGTEIQYLVDDHGDLYFEIEDDNVFLQTLTSSLIYTVLLGFGNVDLIQFSEIFEFQGEEIIYDSDSDGESSDGEGNSDVDIYWDAVDKEDLEGRGESADESFGSLGGWGGAESLGQVHPMDFASKVSESVSADYSSEIDKPVRRLSITGVARPVTKEELSYLRGIWYDRFVVVGNDDQDKEIEDGDGDSILTCEEDLKDRSKAFCTSNPSAVDESTIDIASSSGTTEDMDGLKGSLKVENDADHSEGLPRELGKRKHRKETRGSTVENSDTGSVDLEAVESVLPGATLEGDTVVGKSREQNRIGGSSFFKLEIVSIQLESSPGVQLPVEVQDFAYAEPDILAHFSSTIIERVNGGGKKTEDALKALCLRAKGLDVQAASIISVDSLGVDVRAWCGIEVLTVRLPFRRRATSEETAEKLLDNLLFPRHGQKLPRKWS